MFKPGVFDIENMEPFTTKGVTLFMTLPTESDAHQIFNMMHNAARKIAAEFSATVLDDQRNELTRDGLQAYIERIRDFEKRRLLG
jgi:cell division protein ZipA